MKNLSIFSLVLCIVFPLFNTRSVEEHPRYTAARLTDEYRHILDGKIKLAESHIFTEDITVDDCGKGGDYDYLSSKLEALIPKLGQVDLSVKFAYPVPFTNNTIQFSVDEVLTLLNGEIQSGEKAFFARMEEKDDDYKIYDIRVVPCYPK
ncbi:hypothetical protein CRE_12538 [Caenorhabditis remanei]|uniref:Uncharacterized protein n=1 Tax=Caenorhabditis remanei TaxID=31234 RepID=E3M7J7_CAERE|nr:hypothetical protein CRE_12538 [Caenorhabditis remanei]